MEAFHALSEGGGLSWWVMILGSLPSQCDGDALQRMDNLWIKDLDQARGVEVIDLVERGRLNLLSQNFSIGHRQTKPSKKFKRGQESEEQY